MPLIYKQSANPNVIDVTDSARSDWHQSFVKSDTTGNDTPYWTVLQALVGAGTATILPADPAPPAPVDLQDVALTQLDTDITAAANLADAKVALRKFAQAFRQARKS